MKVYAPKRVVWCYNARALDRSTASVGIPLDGEWVDVDDYFRQVTSGNDINDVIHAKVVDSVGLNLSTETFRDSAGATYYGSFRTLNSDVVGTPSLIRPVATYVPVKVTESYMPDYKGKKPIKPRTRVYWTRKTRTAVIDVSHGSYGGEVAFSCRVYYLAPWLDTPRSRYHVASFTFVIYRRNKQFFVYSYRGNSMFRGVAEGTVVMLEGMGVPSPFRNVDEEHKWSLVGSISSFIESKLFDVLAYAEEHELPESTWARRRLYDVSDVWIDQPEGLRRAFLLDEDLVYGERIDPLLLGKDLHFRNYWRNYLQQHALLSALDSFPKLSDNSISNIMEVVGFIKALVVDRKIEIPKSLQQAWLTYRYQYSTTKMDVEDAVKFVRRHANLGTLSREISCYGVSSTTYEGTTITCRCEITVRPRNVKILDRLLRALDTYGLTPDFYVIWDSIPYSFMVDWFLPISDILSVLDADAKYFSGEFYDLSNLCYSLSYTRELDGVPVKCYTRWAGSVPSSLNSLYWLEAPGASSKTVWYRVLDAVSLFIGH